MCSHILQVRITLDNPTWNMEIPKTDSDIIVLVGDIDVGTRGVKWAIEQSKKLGVDICLTIGNHEFFGGNIDSINRKIREASEGTNVHVLQNDYVDIKGVRFIGSTLWTDLSLFNNRQVASNTILEKMNDYKKIRINKNGSYKRLHPKDTFNFHQLSLAYLAGQLNSSPLPTVVLTHHAPSIQSVADIYKTKIETVAYASDLEEFIKHHKPLAWIHGHTHTCKTYKIGETVIATNQFGYVGVEECSDFDPRKTIDV